MRNMKIISNIDSEMFFITTTLLTNHHPIQTWLFSTYIVSNLILPLRILKSFWFSRNYFLNEQSVGHFSELPKNIFSMASRVPQTKFLPISNIERSIKGNLIWMLLHRGHSKKPLRSQNINQIRRASKFLSLF